MTCKFVTPLIGVAMALAALPVAADPVIRLHSDAPVLVETYSSPMVPGSAAMASMIGKMTGPANVARMPTRTLTVVPQPMALAFDCVVAGTPVEFPNDIHISNANGFATAGVKVAYLAPGGHSGMVTLPPLSPGEGVYVANAVPGGMVAGAACEVHQM